MSSLCLGSIATAQTAAVDPAAVLKLERMTRFLDSQPQFSVGPLPAGTVVTKLPAGCTPTPVGGKNYQYCGGTFYEPVYEGSTLKYVTATPK